MDGLSRVGMGEGRAAPGQTAPRPGRSLVPAMALGVGVNFLGSLALGPFLPTVAEELETSVALLGQIPALTMLLAALLGLIVGPLADQYGYRRTLVVGLLTAGASTLAIGLAPTYPILLALALVGAVGRATVLPVAQAVVGATFADEDERRRALGWTIAGMSGAAILGIPLLTAIAALSHWRVAFLALAGLALGIALVLGRVIPLDRARAPATVRLGAVLAAYVPLLRHRPSLGLIAGTVLVNAGIWSTWTYAAAFYVERHSFTTQHVGWVYLATGVAVLLGNLTAGRLSGVPLGPLVIASGATIGVLLGAGLLLPLPALAVAGLVTLGMLVMGVYLVTAVTVLTAETPAGPATTLTLNGSALSLGVALGGATGGLALALGGYEAVGVASLTWPLLGAGLVWWSCPRSAGPTVPLATASVIGDTFIEKTASGGG